MSLPSHALASEHKEAAYIEPDNLRPPLLTTDYERGGVAISDPSQGLEVQIWTLTYEESRFVLTPQSFGLPVDGPTVANVTEASLAFDQNMNLFIAYVANGQAYYYWYDPIAVMYVHAAMDSDVITPRCCMDDKRDPMVDFSDICLSYVRRNNLYYREQRDRYTIEYPLHEGVWELGAFQRVGMNKENRLQWFFEKLIGAIMPPTYISMSAYPSIEFTIPDSSLVLVGGLNADPLVTFEIEPPITIETVPTDLFIAEMDGTFTTATIDDYVPDLGEGPGSHFGLAFQMNNGFLRIGSRSGNEQGHIWPHQALPDNFDIEFRLQIFINTSQGGQYLQFRSNNSNADSAIIFGLTNGKAALWVTGGSGGFSNAFTFLDNNWYTIKLEVRNVEEMTMYVDSEDGGGFVQVGQDLAVVSTVDAAHQNIGLRTWYTTGGSTDMPILDYIRVVEA